MAKEIWLFKKTLEQQKEIAMTLEPMLRLIAGVFVTASVLLGLFVHPYFLLFTVFVGLNLAQSAFSNWCPMMSFLRRLGVRQNGSAAASKVGSGVI